MTARGSSRAGFVDVGEAIRPGETEGDRDQHARRSGLGDGRPVVELDHRVDLLLRVDDRRDPLERDAKEQVRLDDLQAPC